MITGPVILFSLLVNPQISYLKSLFSFFSFAFATHVKWTEDFCLETSLSFFTVSPAGLNLIYFALKLSLPQKTAQDFRFAILQDMFLLCDHIFIILVTAFKPIFLQCPMKDDKTLLLLLP